MIAPVAAGGRDFPVLIRTSPRARRMSLRLCAASRTIRLTVPPRVSKAAAVAFLEANRLWASAAALRLPPAIPFRPGICLPLGDGELLLAHGPGRMARREGDTLLVPGDDSLFAGRVRRWLAAEALRQLEPETRALAGRIGKPVAQVRVGDTRSRWGSCGHDGRIAYSWRLVLAPIHVRASVVAHEVAHLAEHNHGPRFWALATDLLGTPHDSARRWLRQNGPLLHGYGVAG